MTENWSVWDLINPSDKITFRAPDLQIALVSVICVGNGAFAAHQLPIGAGPGVPFMWRSQDLDEFCTAQWGIGWEQVEARVINDRHVELCESLSSFMYGDAGDRKLIEELLAALPDDEARSTRLAEWNDERRTSTKNIVGSAMALAARVMSISRQEKTKGSNIVS